MYKTTFLYVNENHKIYERTYTSYSMRKFQWFRYTGEKVEREAGLLPHSTKPFTDIKTGTVYTICPSVNAVFVESNAGVSQEIQSELSCEPIKSIQHSDVRSLLLNSDKIDVADLGTKAIRTKDELRGLDTIRSVNSFSIYLNDTKVVTSDPTHNFDIHTTSNQACEDICLKLANALVV